MASTGRPHGPDREKGKEKEREGSVGPAREGEMGRQWPREKWAGDEEEKRNGLARKRNKGRREVLRQMLKQSY